MAEAEKKQKAKIILPDGVTQEMIDAWKERYGADKIFLSTLSNEDNEELCKCIIRAPGRKELGEFEKWVDKNPDRAKEITVKACVLSPNKAEIIADQSKFLSAFDAIAAKFPIGRSSSKNL